jgi:hypothetical protein
VRLPVAGLADAVFEWLLPGQLLVLATALVSLVLRLRRASGEERQQVKWFVYTVVTVVLVFVTTTLALGAGYLFPLFGLIPVSVAVAVFKYRLYDIDRLINRTLVYGLLTALLIGVYAGLVFLLGELLDPATGDSAWPWPPPPWPSPPVPAGPPPGPELVDRRFNRRRYDAARTVERFSGPPPRPGRPRQPSRPSSWPWSTRPSSRPRRRSGCGTASEPHRNLRRGLRSPPPGRRGLVGPGGSS